MDNNNGSYYDVLNISPHATDEDVRNAYRILAKIYHPDHNPNNRKLSNKRFQRVREAYENLKTTEQRMRYNRKMQPPQNDNTERGSWLMQLAERMIASKNKAQTHE